MFSLSTPVWLTGLGVLVVPIALHLWSRRPSQVVRLGTLEHLAGAPGPRAWGRRLDDLPLLALRLLTLAACVLGLAGPRWHPDSPGPSGNSTLVLADPSLVGDSLGFFTDPVVDSLRRSQTPIHLLQDGLPLLGSDGGPTEPTYRTGRTTWSSLLEVDRLLRPEQGLLVLAQPEAQELGVARPTLMRAVRWYRPGNAASDDPRVVESWAGPQDSVVVLTEAAGPFATSRSLRLRHRSEQLTAPGPSAAGSGQPTLNNRSGTFDRVQVHVGSDDSALAQSVVAAVEATLVASQGFAASGAGDAAGSVPDGELIVWLNDQSVSDGTRSRVAAGAWMVQFIEAPPDSLPVLAVLPSSAPTWTGPLPQGTAGAVALEDLLGRPMATVAQHGAGRWLRIGVRPEGWATLAAGDPDLPLLLYRLLSPDRPAGSAPVGAAQASPGYRPPSAASLGGGIDLAPALFWLTLLLLGAERVVAQFRPRGGQ